MLHFNKIPWIYSFLSWTDAMLVRCHSWLTSFRRHANSHCSTISSWYHINLAANNVFLSSEYVQHSHLGAIGSTLLFLCILRNNSVPRAGCQGITYLSAINQCQPSFSSRPLMWFSGSLRSPYSSPNTFLHVKPPIAEIISPRAIISSLKGLLICESQIWRKWKVFAES